jgi:predicted MFS family arabinose efflux permease
MGVFTLDVALLAFLLPDRGNLTETAVLVKTFLFYRVSFDLLATAVCGGIWSVPLQALMQKSAAPEKISQVIAGNNIANSFYMAAGAAAAGSVLKAGAGVGWIFLGIAVCVFCAAAFTCPLAERKLLRGQK